MPFVSRQDGGQRRVIASRSRSGNHVALSQMIQKLQKSFSITAVDSALPAFVSDESFSELLVNICDW